ncbi:hypothetical protein MRX96_037578 [Rhipicephalus microplus]
MAHARHFSGNGSTTAVNMFQTPFRFWVQIFIGFAAWNSLTGSAQAQVLGIPAANDGGINSPNRLNKHPFRFEATETFRASWPRITVALSFPATKSTDASTSASLKSSWNGLRPPLQWEWKHYSRQHVSNTVPFLGADFHRIRRVEQPHWFCASASAGNPGSK